MIQDVQVRKLMKEMSEHGEVGKAAMRCAMDRKTASKYIELGKLPSELHTGRLRSSGGGFGSRTGWRGSGLG